jgi:hypothetical protein
MHVYICQLSSACSVHCYSLYIPVTGRRRNTWIIFSKSTMKWPNLPSDGSCLCHFRPLDSADHNLSELSTFHSLVHSCHRPLTEPMNYILDNDHVNLMRHSGSVIPWTDLRNVHWTWPSTCQNVLQGAVGNSIFDPLIQLSIPTQKEGDHQLSELSDFQLSILFLATNWKHITKMDM